MKTEGNHQNDSGNTFQKRVLFVVTQSEMGGAQRFLSTLLPHLDLSKYAIAIAAGPNQRQEKRGKRQVHTYPLLENLEQQRIKVIRLLHLQREIRPLEDFRACFELRKLIKSFQPDVLFLNSSKAGVLGSLVSKYLILNTKYLILYRIGGWSFNDPWPQWKKSLWIGIEKWTARFKDIIIVNNRHDFDQAKQLGIRPRESLELIHNGLDISELHLLSKEEARQKLGLSADDSVVGTIANFYPPKGLSYLIEAVGKLNDKKAKFVIIGDGEERTKLESLIQENNLSNRVILSGQLDNARQYLKAFDIFVLPSVKEGFPWAVIEAMAAGLPVVATSVGALPEIIDNGKNGTLVEPGNSVALAERIEQLLSNQELRRRFGETAHQTVLENFSLKKMIQKIEKLL